MNLFTRRGLLVLLALASAAWAIPIPTTGQENTWDVGGFTTTLVKGVLTVGGSGTTSAAGEWGDVRLDDYGKQFTAIVFGEGVTSVKNFGLLDYSKKALTSVTFTAVTEIKADAFDGCNNITSITILTDDPPTVGANSFSNKVKASATVYVPEGSVGAYQNWGGFTKIQASGESVVGVYTVKFDANGGSVSSAVRSTGTDGKLAALPTPTKYGYTFGGWFTGEGGTGTAVTVETVFEEKSTVYARWSATVYTITYTLGTTNATKTDQTSYTIETPTFNIIAPTHTDEDTVFNGWTGTNVPTRRTSVIVPQGSTGNREYVANWKSLSAVPPTPAITITKHPDDVTLTVGQVNGTVTLTVEANGPAEGYGSLIYRWYRTTSVTANANYEGQRLSAGSDAANLYTGAADATLEIPEERWVAGTTYYYCHLAVVKSGSTTDSLLLNTNVATVIFNLAPGITITTQPANKSVAKDAAASLEVVAAISPSGTLSYQWYSNTTNSNEGGTSVESATGASLVVPTGTVGTYYYYCVVSGTEGATAVTSNVAAVTVDDVAEIINITKHPTPSDTTLVEGEIKGTDSLRVDAIAVSGSGYGTPTYRWWRCSATEGCGERWQDSLNTARGYSSANGKSLRILSTAADSALKAGTYYFRCRMRATKSGSADAVVWSDFATVTVNPPPAGIKITTQPVNTSVVVNAAATLTVGAVISPATETLGYQWYSNTTSSTDGGEAVAGATSASLTVTKTEVGEYHYYCKVSGGEGIDPVYSSVAKVMVTEKVQIITVTSKSNDTTYVGSIPSNATIKITATAASGYTICTDQSCGAYRWYKLDTPEDINKSLAELATDTVGSKVTDKNIIHTNAGTATLTIPTGLAEGKHYYFCRVRAIKTGVDTVFEKSGVITITKAPTTVTISWNTNGGSAVTAPASVAYNGTINAPTPPTKTGHTFAGWFSDESLETSVSFPIENVKAAQTFYAKWTLNTYTVTWNADGGEPAPMQETVDHGGSIAKPEEITKAGHTFGGWFSDEEFEEAVTFPIEDVTENTTLYAKWTKNDYVVTWNVDGGAPVPTQTGVDSDGEITAPAPMTKTGYTFVGWFSDEALETPVAFPITNVTKDTTLYAKWVLENYAITYNLGGGDYDLDGGTVEPVNPASYTIEAATFTLNNPIRTGYTFAGWTGSNGTSPQTTVSVAKGSAGNKEYTANWEPITYTITYDLGGGTVGTANPASYTIETATFTLNNPTKTGYTFAGWTGSNGLSPETSVSIVLGNYGNRSHTANWTAITYSISVENDGHGTGTATPATATIGTEVTLTAVPADGYQFGSWEVVSGGVTVAEDKFTMPAGNVTVKAVFEAIDYNVTVQNDGHGTGTATPTTATIGTEVTLTAAASSGYQFKEWQVVSGDVTVAENKFTMPAGNVTVKAVFEAIDYSVTVQNDGHGTATAALATAIIGTEVTLTAAPADGYQFGSWEVVSGGVTVTDGKFTMSASDVVVKANFTAIGYTVTVNNDEHGTVTATPESGIIGTEVTLTATAGSGYQFKEWQVASGDVTVAVTDDKFTMPAGNVTVKAVFEAITYTVTVQKDGLGTATATPATATIGTEITLTAVASSGYQFKEWQVVSGGVTVTTDGKFTMPAGDVTVKAVFEKTYALTFSSNIEESATLSAKNASNVAYASESAEAGTLASGDKITFTVSVTNQEEYSTQEVKNWKVNGKELAPPITALTYVHTVAADATVGVILMPISDLQAEVKAAVDQIIVIVKDESTGFVDSVTSDNGYALSLTATEVELPYGEQLEAFVANYVKDLLDDVKELLKEKDVSESVQIAIATGKEDENNAAKHTPQYVSPTVEKAGSYTYWLYVKRNPYEYVGPFIVCIPKVPTYMVTWNADGGAPAPTPTTVNHGGSVTAPATMTKTGYTLAGWYTDEAKTVAVTFPITNVTECKTLYAKWTINTYTVTWNVDGGTAIAAQTVNHGTSVSAPAAPTRAGYTFGGWFTNEAKTTAASFPITVTANTTLYAKWTSITYTYTISASTLTSFGSLVTPYSQPSAQTVTITNTGTGAVTLTQPTSTKYDIGTLSTTSLAVGGTATFTVRPKAGLVAGTHNETITVSGSSGASASVPVSFSVTSPSTSNNTGGGTSGGGTTGGGTSGGGTSGGGTSGGGTTAGGGTTGGGTTTTPTVTTYTISFNANGGTVSPSSEKTDGDKVLWSIPTPERSGYMFDGWFTSSSGGTEVTSGTVFKGNSTIYAHWTLVVYTVTFNPAGGTVSVASGKTVAGGRLSSLPTPTNTGYAFDGWYLGGTKVTTSYVFDGDATLYAQWSPIYTVTFNGNGGTSASATGKTGSGGKLTSLPTATKAGYAIEGWYTEATGGTKVTTSYVFYGDAVVYAHWVVSYTITFDADSGTVEVASGATVAGGKLASLPTPTKSGYDFVGWYTAAEEGTQVTTSTVFNANAVVYAHWTPSISVIGSGRVVPGVGSGDGSAAVAPVKLSAAELAVGPSLVDRRSGAVSFFRDGAAIEDATLYIYDGLGNLVKKVVVRDKASPGVGRRVVGAWDLRDVNGRLVPEGVYAVKGAIGVRGGKKELVSLMFSVR